MPLASPPGRRTACDTRARLNVEILEDRTVPAAISLGGSLGIEDLSQPQSFSWSTTTSFVNFPNFANAAPLTLNNDAHVMTTSDGPVLRLLGAQTWRSGSAFSTVQGDASSFSTSFRFRITNPGGAQDPTGAGGGDGMVFVIQNVASNVGTAGGGIGYMGIPNSVGIEFDTWRNDPFHDPSSNHLGIDIAGQIDHGTGSPYTIDVSPDFDDGNIWYAWVDYDGTTLQVRANQTGVRPAAPLLSRVLDIPTILNSPTAYLGFTSGTGNAYENVDILSWRYDNPAAGFAVNITKNGDSIYSTSDLASLNGTFDFNSYGTGLYQITVSNTDLAGSTTTATRSVVVIDASLIFTAGNRVVLEGDSISYGVALKTRPDAPITISLDVDPLQASVFPATLTFTPDNFDVPQSVTVSTINDPAVQDNRLLVMSHSLDTGNPVQPTVALASYTADVIDDDNVLLIRGNETADTIKIIFSANLIQVVHNGKATFYPTTYNQVLVLPSDGDDSIQLFSPSIPVSVLGGTGDDSLTINGPVSSNDFQIDWFRVMINTRRVDFGEVERVILNGNRLADRFTILSVLDYALTLQGAAGLDTLTGPDEAHRWQIKPASSGLLDDNITFVSVESLIGNVGDDTFAFTAQGKVSGLIDGGGGNNTLDFSAYRVPLLANLQRKTLTGTGGFRNIGSLIGGAASDRLVGLNAASAWNITGSNAGNVAGLTFTGFENLTGGTQADSFVFGDGARLGGKIDGGGGIDSLDLSAFTTAVTVNLQSKSATNIGGFANLEQFAASSVMSTLVAANRVNTWTVTGTGAGTLTGGYSFQGFANLTGGSSADTFAVSNAADWLGILDGGAGLDTLIAPASDTYDLSGPSTGTLGGKAFRNIENRR